MRSTASSTLLFRPATRTPQARSPRPSRRSRCPPVRVTRSSSSSCRSSNRQRYQDGGGLKAPSFFGKGFKPMRKFLTAAMLVLSSMAAQAQLSEVPPEEIDNSVRLSGDTLRVCFDRTSVIRAFDGDVANAIGEALFLTVEVQE